MKKTVSESDNKTGDIYNNNVVSDCCKAELIVEESGVSQMSFSLTAQCSKCKEMIKW